MNKRETSSVFLLAFQKEYESMDLLVCFLTVDQSSPRAEGRRGPTGPLIMPHACLGPREPPGLPTSQENGLLLSSPLWRDADAVSFSDLAFSGLTPESNELAPANLCDREQSCHGLTQEDLQVPGFLFTPHSRCPLSPPWVVPEQGLEVSNGQAEREGEAVS